MFRVGIFDSGLGGLTTLCAIIDKIYNIEIYYIADTIHAPYGDKTQNEILKYSISITDYLILNHNIDALIVACNSATAYSINHLRIHYPHLIIIGTEPAIKPAFKQTKTNNIALLATKATINGDKYNTLSSSLSKDRDVNIYNIACIGLVELIENGEIDSDETKKLLAKLLEPMKENNIDTIVLGCTHYPLIKHHIEDIMNDKVNIIDSKEAISSYLLKKIIDKGHYNIGDIKINIFYTGNIKIDMINNIINRNKTISKIDIVTN